MGRLAREARALHALAVSLVTQARGDGRRLVTTKDVLNELVALLTSPLRMPRGQQIQLLTDLRAATWVDIIHIDSALDLAAWALWRSRPDKDWSLVDCAGFVIMHQRQGLTESLTVDHHFDQAGFIRLLKSGVPNQFG
jgi:predicted nucleic acid-binding protein